MEKNENKRKIPLGINIIETTKIVRAGKNYSRINIPPRIDKILNLQEYHEKEGTYISFKILDGKLTIEVTDEFGNKLYE